MNFFIKGQQCCMFQVTWGIKWVVYPYDTVLCMKAVRNII